MEPMPRQTPIIKKIKPKATMTIVPYEEDLPEGYNKVFSGRG
jgi:hypothetical protein